MMRKLTADDFLHMPWKNGGGVTVQIAIGPPHATVDDFDWRVSTASVAAPGPFSTFTGIDRSLAVIAGRGLRLITQRDGARVETVLDLRSDAWSFAGEWPVHGELIGGEAVLDFNVMTRRKRFENRLRRLTVSEPTCVSADVVVLYALEGRVDCRDAARAGSPPASLAAGEAIVAEGQCGSPVTLRCAASGDESARILAVELFSVEQIQG